MTIDTITVFLFFLIIIFMMIIMIFDTFQDAFQDTFRLNLIGNLKSFFSSARETLKNNHNKIKKRLSIKLLALAVVCVAGIYFTLDSAPTLPNSFFSQISKLTKPTPQQPATTPVPVEEKSVLPVAQPADADESVKLQVPVVTSKQPISEGSVDVPTIPVLPQPLTQSSQLDYGRLLERVQKKSLAKPVQLFEQKQAEVASEDDGTGVHVELRNAQKQTVSEVAAENDAVKVKIELKKADATNEKKNGEALPLDEKASPEYKILQETENGVLIRQGNKVSLIRPGEKLPDGNKVSEK